MLELLVKRGELVKTLVIVTSDHGMAFPRAKTNLYDAGMRAPVAMMWGMHFLRRADSKAL